MTAHGRTWRRRLLLLASGAALLAGLPTDPAVRAAVAPSAAAPCDTLVRFRLKDQFDRLVTDGRLRGAPLLLAWGDRKGDDFRKEWVPVLTDSLQADIAGYRVRVISAAHAKGAPFFVKGKIKGSFSRDRERRVLLDWGGALAAAYDPVPDRCNLLLFDRDSRLVARWDVGTLDADTLRTVLDAVAAAVARR